MYLTPCQITQINFKLDLYASRHGGKAPASLTELGLAPDKLQCPVLGRHYVYLGPFKDGKLPSHGVLLYEAIDTPGWSNVAAFLGADDGQIHYVEPDVAKKLIASPGMNVADAQSKP